MKEISFNEFVQKFPRWKEQLEVVKKDDTTFQRVIGHWKETIQDPKSGKNQVLNNEYHACIDTRTGEIYNDDSKKIIFYKHTELLFARPVYIFFKTIWHLSILAPLILEIALYINAKKHPKEEKVTWEDIKKNTFHSLLDIFRTPFYGTAMTIVHLFAVICGCVSPNSLYHTRAWVGYLERKMLRISDPTEKAIGRQLSPCFSPINSMMKTYNNEYDKATRSYCIRTASLSDEESMQALREENNRLAQENIKFLRSEQSLCNPEDREYRSDVMRCPC